MLILQPTLCVPPSGRRLQELHAAYAEQLGSRAQHEAAAAHLLAAGRWADAAAALCSRGTALAAAAAVQLCRQALARGPGAELSAADESRLQRQLGAAEKQLLAVAAAEGIDPGAALAAAALPSTMPPLHDQQAGQADAEVEPGSASAQQRQRYSARLLLAVGSALPAMQLAGLPADLAASAADVGDPSCSHGPTCAPAVPAGAGASSGGPRRRYTRQSLLQLSACVSCVDEQLLQAIPAELQPDGC